LARAANRVLPELRSHDRFGNRVDRIDFHPAWHELMGLAIGQGTVSLAWRDPRPGAQVARGAVFYLWNQGEAGICCPIEMTYSAVPVLRRDPARWAEWGELILSDRYDGRQIRAGEKTGATVGMAMTEKQGGSDLRQTQTAATPNGDGTWSITGHKWFFSVPQSDVFLTLARTPEGVSCFVVAGWLPDGSRNRLQLQRLKDKCGNRSNASSEVEFRGAIAHLIGEPGRGIRTGLSMNHTRLDCALGSAALMRQAVAQAAHHARHRSAFQKKLIDQPLMTNVLADLALECEAATVLTLRLARAYDEDDEAAQVIRRIMTPAGKFWICKRAPSLALEAMEVLGGNGYVEESIMPRIYREMPVNSIWEGSGNVMCLDVLRAIGRMPNAGSVLGEELASAGDARVNAFAGRLQKRLGSANDESQARALVRDLVLALQGALLVKHAPSEVADAFCASRLNGEAGGAFGTLPRGLDLRAIAERALP
jgi:putative acyl-CoA dehydrogenase